MGRNSYFPVQIINKLRGTEIHINQGIAISEASRKIVVTEQTYYRCSRFFNDEVIKPWKK